MLIKKIIPLLLSVCLLAGTCIVPVNALEADEGSDVVATFTADWRSDYDTADEFIISTVEDLQNFSNMVNAESNAKDFSGKTVKLSADLDMTDVTWIPIGSTNNNGEPGNAKFAGTFDGQGYSISNITLSYGIKDDDPVYDAGGLFGMVSGTIKDVKVVNISLTAAMNNLGGIAGILESNATVENCSVSGTISGAEYDDIAFGNQVGGIVGYSEGTVRGCVSSCTIQKTLYCVGGIAGEIKNGATIEDCNNSGNVEGFGLTGGIVGDSSNSTIYKCSNSGTITGKENAANTEENRRVAGIVGEALQTTISGCENTGKVNAQKLHEVGGVVGELYMSTATGCTNSGNIVGGDQTGGIVGQADAYSSGGYTVENCTNTGKVDGKYDVGGVVGRGAYKMTTSPAPEQTISGCTNSGEVGGEGDVGGIVGEHNSDIYGGSATNPATVSGCINTGSVPESGGAIVGNNSTALSVEGALPGTVENNFWPAELGVSAVGSGAGSSEENAAPDSVKNNSSYNSDGTLTTHVTDADGNKLGTIGDAANTLLGGS